MVFWGRGGDYAWVQLRLHPVTLRLIKNTRSAAHGEDLTVSRARKGGAVFVAVLVAGFFKKVAVGIAVMGITVQLDVVAMHWAAARNEIKKQRHQPMRENLEK